MCAAQTDPDLAVGSSRTVRLVDGQYLALLLLRQSQKRLDMVELVHVFSLVKQDFAVRVVDDGLFHNRRRDDVVHLLGHHNGLAEILADGLEKVQNIGTHVGGHQCFPALLDQHDLADAFQPAHLGDEGLHDNERHHRQQHLVGGDVVQLEHDEALVRQVQALV